MHSAQTGLESGLPRLPSLRPLLLILLLLLPSVVGNRRKVAPNIEGGFAADAFRLRLTGAPVPEPVPARSVEPPKWKWAPTEQPRGAPTAADEPPPSVLSADTVAHSTVGCPDALDYSFVLATRNDGHGGDLLHRLRNTVQQISKFNWAAYGSSAEVVIVDWNPDPSLPPLRNQLQVEGTSAAIRIITFPASVHRLLVSWWYPGALRGRKGGQLHTAPDSVRFLLPHARNAGIRRASGRWVVVMQEEDIPSIPFLTHLAQHKGTLREDAYYMQVRFNLPAPSHGYPFTGDDPRVLGELSPFSRQGAGEQHLCDVRPNGNASMWWEANVQAKKENWLGTSSVHHVTVRPPGFVMATCQAFYRARGYAQLGHGNGMEVELGCRLQHKHRLAPMLFAPGHHHTATSADVASQLDAHARMAPIHGLCNLYHQPHRDRTPDPSATFGKMHGRGNFFNVNEACTSHKRDGIASTYVEDTGAVKADWGYADMALAEDLFPPGGGGHVPRSLESMDSKEVNLISSMGTPRLDTRQSYFNRFIGR